MKKIGIGIFIGVAIIIMIAAGVGNFKYLDLEYDSGTFVKYNRLSTGKGDSLYFRESDESTNHLLYPNKAFSSGYVPYTGADSTLNMGTHDIIVDSLNATKAQIDTLGIIMMDVTTAFIDSGCVMFTDYDDLSSIMSYSDTVLTIDKEFDSVLEVGVDNTVVIQDVLNIFRKAEINSKVWETGIDILEGQGVYPNIPYYAESDSLAPSLIEYTAIKTVFNQDIEVDTLVADGINLKNKSVGSSAIVLGNANITVSCVGCLSTDYVFITNTKPSGSVDILTLYVDCLVDSFIVYTDNNETLATDLPFNWLRIRGE